MEGTISQFKRLMQNGKLRVRGDGRIRNNVILMAIGINFKRLWAYVQENSLEQALLLSNTIILLRYLVLKWLERIQALSFC